MAWTLKTTSKRYEHNITPSFPISPCRPLLVQFRFVDEGIDPCLWGEWVHLGVERTNDEPQGSCGRGDGELR